MKKPLFISSNPELNKALANIDYEGHYGISRSVGTVGRTFIDYDTNISVKSEYNRGDYNSFRRGESTSNLSYYDRIRYCDRAYEKIGIIQTAVNLMADFACTGIRFQHKNKQIENFYNTWFRKVNGRERSERFLNLLYRLGNVVVYRELGPIKITDVRSYKKTIAKNFPVEELKTKRREIPLKYVFYNPCQLEVVGDAMAIMSDTRLYKLKVDAKLRSDLKAVLDRVDQDIQSEFMKNLPSNLLGLIQQGKGEVLLDPMHTDSYFYKKDDWQLWANPMIYPILDDLVIYDKLRLADISALDGAISNVRLWTLGIYNQDNPVNSILPTPEGLNKLRTILSNSVGGGTLDLVWGPGLSFTESQTQVHRFLGSEKYKVTLDSIYDGLGIPSPLRSGDGKSGSTNFMSLRTLIERLEYGRDMLLMFWYKEAEIVRKAMGWEVLPHITFDNITLADEAAEKALWIQLIDRDLVSPETLQERFGCNPEIESNRIIRSVRKRGKSVPEKAGPFHNPQWELDMRKIVFNGGVVAPSEIGVELLPRKEGETTPGELQVSLRKLQNEAKMAGVSGRPKNVTETKKRAPKPTNKPRTSAEQSEFMNMFIWALNVQEDISKIMGSYLLKLYEKKSFRELSRAQFEEAELVKFRVLCNLQPYSQITPELVYNSLNDISVEYYELVKELKVTFSEIYKREPVIDELRQIQASAYSVFKLQQN